MKMGIIVQLVLTGLIFALWQSKAMSQTISTICDEQPVIMVVDGRTIDRERMRAYTQKLLASGLYAQLGGYYLNSPRPIATFEGETAVDHVTLMVRFPCIGNARAFWYSRTYQETIKPLRLDPIAGDFTVRIYSEIAAPAYMADAVESSHYRKTFSTEPVPLTRDLPEPPVTTPAPSLRRITLVVADLERSIAFYRDILGLSAGIAHTVDPEGSGKALFGIHAGVPARFVTLSAGSAGREIIGLIENPSFRGRKSQDVAVVLKVPVRLEKIVPRLAQSNAMLFPPSMAGTNKEQAVYDPDGHLVVLYELGQP